MAELNEKAYSHAAYKFDTCIPHGKVYEVNANKYGEALRKSIAAYLDALPDGAGRSIEGWRPEVRAFADLMEAQLKANDHKPGWKNDDWRALRMRLGDEMRELFAACVRKETGRDHADIGPEAADVANFAMMIADVCGALPTPTSNSPMANRETAAHQEIWLECACGDGHEERTWCDHDAWGTCENPNCAGPVKFIRASDQLYCALAADDGGA